MIGPRLGVIAALEVGNDMAKGEFQAVLPPTIDAPFNALTRWSK